MNEQQSTGLNNALSTHVKKEAMGQLFPILQSVCRYRCAALGGGNYKCAKGDNFAAFCNQQNCKLIKQTK